MTAAAFLVGVAVGIAFLSICNAWDRQPVSQPRLPVSSNRKAARR